MGGSFRIRSLQRSFCNLAEIGFVRIVVVGLQVAECRRLWIRSVVCNGYCLGIPQFHEGLHVEAIVGLCVVGFRGRDIGTMRKRLARKKAHAGVVAALREVVADFESVLSAAQITRSTS